MSYDAPKTTRQVVGALWKWVRAIPRRLTQDELHARAVERKQKADAIRYLQAQSGTRHSNHWWAKRLARHSGAYSKRFLAAFNFIRDNGRNPVYNNASGRDHKVARGSVEHRAWDKGFRDALAAADARS